MRHQWRRYVPAAERRTKAARAVQKLAKKGRTASPVFIEGRVIARTFWGKAWCTNLERYSDYSNRLPRGRTYVRNGSVVDLQIAPGEVKAVVSGSRIYQTAVQVSALPRGRWASICADCAGSIDSLVELLQGRFSKGVMERICQQATGLFPAPSEIKLSCSCPDWASMCKHVAAVLYAIGARLDEEPELLFQLRRVNEKDLLTYAGSGLPLSSRGPSQARVLAAEGLSELFGLEMAASAGEPLPARGVPQKASRRRSAKKARGQGKTKVSLAATSRVAGQADDALPATSSSSARRKRPVSSRKTRNPGARAEPKTKKRRP